MTLTCRRHDGSNPNTKAGRLVGQRGFHGVLRIESEQPGLACCLSILGCNDQNERRLAAQGRHLVDAWEAKHNGRGGEALLTVLPMRQ